MAKFISAKFTGDRFDNHRLPAEFLSDLYQYTELITKLAAHLYKYNNNRTTVPAEVRGRFKLSMNGLRPGSAIADFVDDSAEETVDEQRNDEHVLLGLARDMVNRIITNPDMNNLPLEFPKEYLSYFPKLGKSITVGESIVFDNSGEFIEGGQVIRFDTNVRNRLTPVKLPYKKSFVFTGRVDNISNSKETITFGNFDAKVFYTTKLPKAFEDEFRDAHHNYKDRDVRFFCLATFAPNGSVTKINKLQHAIIHTADGIEMIPDAYSKLTQIEELKEGWADGDGRAFTPDEISKTRTLLDALLSNQTVPSPFIYADPDGIISFQWDLGHWNVSCDLNFQEDEIIIHAMNMDSNDIKNDSRDIIVESGADLIEFLSELTTIEVINV
jgi:hypothetical protein